MASTEAVRLLETIYGRTAKQTREILAAQEPGDPEVDDALMLIGNASDTLVTGIAGAWGFDFKARITGWWIQEIDGTSGSITLGLQKAPRGTAPSFASIVASDPPTVTTARYAEGSALTGWTTLINRADIIRLHVTTVATFTRLLVGLRIRRLEP